MNVDNILQKFERFGVHLGLEAIQQLLADLGNPHDRVPIIHVAGSNGKGSVCAYLSSVLSEAGYRVGRYTSPHLVSWCERICICDRPISSEALQQVLAQVEAAIRPDRPSPTQFEVITAAMWLYFAQQQVEIAVIEVGLGGRLDATNVCDRPLVSIITSLSREHWQRLGSTLAEIAYEKAGILKPGCPAVIGQIPLEAKEVVDQRIADLSCPAVYPEAAQDLGDGWVVYTPQISTLKTQNPIRYRLSLQGDIQRQNSALAIAALQILQQQGWQISDSAIASGIAKTEWAGRLQWCTWKNQSFLIDGAHNPASAEVLRQFVDRTPTERASVRKQKGFSAQQSKPAVRWVMGMLSTKDHADIFRALLRSQDAVYLVPVPGHSSAKPEELATLATQICSDLSHCCVYEDLFLGLDAAMQTVDDELIVLCGSLYLIGYFFEKVQSQSEFNQRKH